MNSLRCLSHFPRNLITGLLAGVLAALPFRTAVPIKVYAAARPEPASTQHRLRLSVRDSGSNAPAHGEGIFPHRPSAARPISGPLFSSQPTEAEIRHARIFEEPLLPMGRPSATENKDLARALQTFLRAKDQDDASALTGFLKRHPHSAWRASLLTNLGMVYRKTGYFSRALSAWEAAWEASKKETGLAERALADRAAGELADLRARLGQDERLQALLAELDGRDLRGPATEKMTAAREGLWQIQHQPRDSFQCGLFALTWVRSTLQSETILNIKAEALPVSAQGASLAQLQSLAQQWGLSYGMAKRAHGAPIPTPAVVHWKVGHFGALVKEQNGRYLLKDPTADLAFGGEIWVSPAAIEAETSGYFLIPVKNRWAGWQPVSQKEGATVWGKGYTSSSNPNGTKSNDKKVPDDNDCQKNGKGMAKYAVHAMLVSLNIEDTPVGYTPPRGPAINFTVTYNQREANQPAVFTYSNLGAKWTFNWLSYVVDDPTNPLANAALYVQGGGTESYTRFDTARQAYAPQMESRAVLARTSPTTYERRLPDGSKQIFSVSDGATIYPRKTFLTQIVDPFGNTVTLTYDAGRRITNIRDALGQVTTLSYELPDEPLKITKVTTPSAVPPSSNMTVPGSSYALRT